MSHPTPTPFLPQAPSLQHVYKAWYFRHFTVCILCLAVNYPAFSQQPYYPQPYPHPQNQYQRQHPSQAQQAQHQQPVSRSQYKQHDAVTSPQSSPEKTDEQSANALSAKAQHAMQRGDYAEAYCMLRPLANRGNAESEYTLGWMYFNGYGLSVDEARAILWWTKAADQGHAEASFAIAMAYLAGEGVDKDEGTALEWLLRAAKHGQEDAAYIIRSRVGLGSKAAKAFVKDLIRTNSSILNERLWIRVSKANVRNGPAKGHKLLVTLKKNDPLIELNRRGKWLQIGIPGTETLGWIYSTLVTKKPPEAS